MGGLSFDKKVHVRRHPMCGRGRSEVLEQHSIHRGAFEQWGGVLSAGDERGGGPRLHGSGGRLRVADALHNQV